MRKILIGVLSVAGLLATVLALASSSATAQMVVAFQTDTEPGTYSVSWSTRGGCDPSRPNANTTLATDGATGTRSGTVSAPSGLPATASVTDPDVVVAAEGTPIINQGSRVEFSIAVAQHCTYDYSVAFTSSAGGSKGIRCAVGYSIRFGEENAVVMDGSRTGVLTFTEAPGTFADEIVLSVEDGDADGAVALCNTVASVSVSIPRPSILDEDDKIVPTQPHSGAILNTTFTVTANPVKDSNDECEAVSEETETKDVFDNNNGRDSTDDDTVGASLTVVQTPLSDESATCEYEVSTDLPGGFVPVTRNSHKADLEDYGLTPAMKLVDDDDPDTALAAVDTTLADCGQTVAPVIVGNDPVVKGHRCITLDVEVALRNMYIRRTSSVTPVARTPGTASPSTINAPSRMTSRATWWARRSAAFRPRGP